MGLDGWTAMTYYLQILRFRQCAQNAYIVGRVGLNILLIRTTSQIYNFNTWTVAMG
jgi:hypothetical protein